MGTRKNGGCQVIGEGGGKRFSGAFRAGAPSPLACLPLARPFSLSPTTSKRLLRRLLRNLLFLSRQQCRFTTLFKFLVYFIYNNFYYWISIKGFSKHERSTINMLYSLKKNCHLTLLPPYRPVISAPGVAVVERFGCISISGVSSGGKGPVIIYHRGRGGGGGGFGA